MAFEEDFKTYGIIEKEIEGRKFKIKQFTPGEVDEIGDKSTVEKEIEGVKKTIFSIKKQNTNLLVEGVIDAPWIIDGKPWKEVKKEKKAELFENEIDINIRTQLLKFVGGANAVQDIKKK